MRSRRLPCFLLLLALAGCAAPPSPLPMIDQIVEVRLTVMAPECKAVLKDRAAITEVLDWLRAIDWSQRGTDLSVVRIQQPDGTIELVLGEGEPLRFHFYWDGKFVDVRANRLIRGGDIDKLREIVGRACK